MGRGGDRERKLGVIPWSEVEKHNKRDDKWIVIDGEVYDITNWAPKHPGGSRVISHYAGQEATEAFVAFHKDGDFVRKYMEAMHVGSVKQEKRPGDEMRQDFEELRQKVEKMGMFKPSKTFFITTIMEVIFYEIAAYSIMYYFGTGWIPWLTSLVLFVTLQIQVAYLSHDCGHLSLFEKPSWNEWAHRISFCAMKGASRGWWQHLHNQHHAKPNVLHKDPDVRLDAIFVVGETMPKQVAQKRKRSPPFNWQHRYFFLVGPPLLFPVYFHYVGIRHPITRRLWKDIAFMLVFFIRFMMIFTNFLGFFGMLKFYFMMRVLESHWFVWVSQSNHIPMEIDDDKFRPWLELQLTATCNVEQSRFNDWFTGHLDFQIEHHCFPTMPRHNLYKVQPLVKELCKKHGIKYQTKTLWGAFSDIVKSLKTSGEIWSIYYNAYHHQ